MDKIVSGKSYKSRLTKRLHMHRRQNNNTGDTFQYSNIDKDVMDQDNTSRRHGYLGFLNDFHDMPGQVMPHYPMRPPLASNSSSTISPSYSGAQNSLRSSSVYSDVPYSPRTDLSRHESLLEIPLEDAVERRLPRGTNSSMYAAKTPEDQGAQLLGSKLPGTPRQLDSYHTRTDPFYEYPSLKSTPKPRTVTRFKPSPSLASSATRSRRDKTFGSSYRHSLLQDSIEDLTYDAQSTASSSYYVLSKASSYEPLPYKPKHTIGDRAPRRWYGHWSTREKILVATGIVLFTVLAVGLGVGLWRQKMQTAQVGLTPAWRPAIGTTWQIQLNSTPTASSSQAQTQVYDIDLFDNSADTIKHLHASGRRVVCYFSAGTYEDWRPDASKFSAKDFGNALQGWDGERWLDTRAQSVRNVMASRVQLAVQKGCDGVDPDNVDGYAGNTSFPLTVEDGVDYVKFLANQAHTSSIAIGLKNAPAMVNETLDDVEWAINESCAQYDECAGFQPVISAGKPVFHIEYSDSANATALKQACNAPGSHGFSTLMKRMTLDSWYMTCPFGDWSYEIY